MATGGDEQGGYSLVKERTITLKNANKRPNYTSIVICQRKIIVVEYKGEYNDETEVKIYRLLDGEFLDVLDRDCYPRSICLMDATTICVLHHDGLIQMVCIKSEDTSPVFTIISSFHLRGVFDYCYSVVKYQKNIVVVVGKIDTTLYWCIVSLKKKKKDVTIPVVCNAGDEYGQHYLKDGRKFETRWNYIAIKDDTIYHLLYGFSKLKKNGVYAFDLSNPRNSRDEYTDMTLYDNTSVIITEDGTIFLSNGIYRIDQLTAACRFVTSFTKDIPWNLNAMFWDNGRLYITRMMSRDVTVLRHMYQGNPIQSEALLSDVSAVHISQGNADSEQSSVDTEMSLSGSSTEDSEDEKHGRHTDSEVSITDEEN